MAENPDPETGPTVPNGARGFAASPVPAICTSRVMSQNPPRSIEVEGRSVQDAIAKALALLRVPRSAVTIRVLAEENKGLFGMRGAKPAQVRATLKGEKKG